MHKAPKLPGRKGRKWTVFSLMCYEGLCRDDELCSCLLCFFEVRLRDKEIERLNQALQGGRPQDVISLEAQNVNHEKMIANLNLQVCTSATVSVWSEWPESLRPHPLVCGCFIYRLLLCCVTVRVSAGDQQDSGGEGPGLAPEEEARLHRGGQLVVEELGAVRGAHPHRPLGQADGD